MVSSLASYRFDQVSIREDCTKYPQQKENAEDNLVTSPAIPKYARSRMLPALAMETLTIRFVCSSILVLHHALAVSIKGKPRKSCASFFAISHHS